MAITHYCIMHAFLRGHHTSLNEVRPIVLATEMKLGDSSFWQYKVYGMWIFSWFPGDGHQTTVGCFSPTTCICLMHISVA